MAATERGTSSWKCQLLLHNAPSRCRILSHVGNVTSAAFHLLSSFHLAGTQVSNNLQWNFLKPIPTYSAAHTLDWKRRLSWGYRKAKQKLPVNRLWLGVDLMQWSRRCCGDDERFAVAEYGLKWTKNEEEQGEHQYAGCCAQCYLFFAATVDGEHHLLQ